MTLSNVQRKLSGLFIAGLLLFASCESNDGIDLDANAVTTEEALNVVLADDISTEIDEVIEDDGIESGFESKSAAPSSNHPSCVVRTSEETATGKIVTLDFGDGCEGKRGREFAGKIIIEYVKTDSSFSKSVTFENFSVEGNSVEGGKSIVKVKENSNGNPEATFTIDIKITLESGVEIIKKGTKVKEKIEGADTDDRGDDVYSISGNWESINKNGVVKTATITTNLRREWACKYIVSGVIELSRDGATATLDFGDGSCDNLATLTDANGDTKEITLKLNKKKK
ncbi:hypothetical protein F7018_02600 [Tenacibaculum aiptasiae]|uniref:Uncharacterized protein n=1 Tax=Tenacibaculum aiptasiae TaxID=426481 RepID=A0A7J5AT13_9FLAO|nr:hypothetical protein [Tenacibaculum aiptasiae]KAB1160782.1 hypothetical protein F7018_02600 [Tenacibaculum aiptasiae]